MPNSLTDQCTSCVDNRGSFDASAKQEMDDVTQILNRINAGEDSAVEELLMIVYDQLRLIASSKLNLENPGNSLQTADLVNEAYLRLLGHSGDNNWRDRGHFFGAAAEAMRRILVDRVRQKRSQKRGADAKRVDLDGSLIADRVKGDELLAVHEALNDLQQCHAEAAQIVKLRYFVGMTYKEAADAMGISEHQAYRHWLTGKTWLYRWMTTGSGKGPAK